MTDRDVIERAYAIFDLANTRAKIATQKQQQPHHKPHYTVTVIGTKAAAWMMMLYQFMGQRRQQKIREVLAAWQAIKANPKKSRYSSRLES